MTASFVYLRPVKQLLQETPALVNDSLRGSLLAVRGDIEVMIGIHKKFLSDMSIRSSGWNEETQLGDIFLEFCNPMKTYFSYMNHYQTLIPLLRETKGTRFAELLESMKQPACKGKGLRDFLIMPAQRIPRYAMLLSDLSKNTGVNHPDHTNLIHATEQFLALSDQVDRDLADFKALEQCVNLAPQLIFQQPQAKFSLIAPHRRYADEFEVRYLLPEFQKPGDEPVVQSGVLFLFNDMVLFCSGEDKQGKRTVERIQFIDGLFFAEKEVQGARAVQFLYNRNGQPLLTIWPHDSTALLRVLETIAQRNREGNLQHITTVPVQTKCRRDHSSLTHLSDSSMPHSPTSAGERRGSCTNASSPRGGVGFQNKLVPSNPDLRTHHNFLFARNAEPAEEAPEIKLRQTNRRRSSSRKIMVIRKGSEGSPFPADDVVQHIVPLRPQGCSS